VKILQFNTPGLRLPGTINIIYFNTLWKFIMKLSTNTRTQAVAQLILKIQDDRLILSRQLSYFKISIDHYV